MSARHGSLRPAAPARPGSMVAAAVAAVALLALSALGTLGCASRPADAPASPAGRATDALATGEAPEESIEIPTERLVGTWQGELQALFGQTLDVFLHVRETDDGELAATVDSPDQKQMGVPVTRLEIDGMAVELDVARLGGSFAGDLSLGAGTETVSGTWRQHGLSFPLSLTRTTDEPLH